MQTHTSQDLSKFLHDRGFRGESEWYWVWVTKKNPQLISSATYNSDFWKESKHLLFDGNEVKAYDLLWDICIKYGVILFGEHEVSYIGEMHKCCQLRSMHVLDFLRESRYKEAEQYIKDNTIL